MVRGSPQVTCEPWSLWKKYNTLAAQEKMPDHCFKLSYFLTSYSHFYSISQDWEKKVSQI